MRARLCALVLLSSLVPAAAYAGNDDGVLLGNDAAMTGGAVTAIVGDGSAAWYNPAGLAQVDRNIVDVSGSAFVLRVGVAPGLLSSATGNEADGGYVEFISVPSALTLVRDLGSGIHGAVGIFVPRFTGHTDIVSLDEPTATGLTHWQLTQELNASEFHVGGGLGFRIDDTFRVGASLFFVYRNLFLDSTFTGGFFAADGTPIAAAAFAGRLNLEALGLEVAVGLQWQPIEQLHIGLSVLSPGLNFAARYRVVNFALSGSAGGPVAFDAADVGSLEARGDLISPARVRLGIAYEWEGGWASIEGDVSHPLDNPDIGIDRRTVGGVRLGTRFLVDPKLALGFGLFTDLSPSRSPSEFGQMHIDFFGGTAGIEIRNEHRLGEGESASTIQFSTTAAVRYAVGIGQIGGLALDTSAPAGESIRPVPVDTVVHEISLHLGSAVYF